MNIEKMPLAQFRKAPTHEVRENEIVCVMVHKREAFYSVSPERMKKLLIAEKMLNRTKQDNEDLYPDIPF